MRYRAIRALLLVAALWLAALPLAAAGRVVAIGDIHGAVDSFVALLARTGLTDAQGRWTGGDATLVQTGDFLDRGARVREAVELLRRLESEAAAAGGRVVVLLGNHEAMNLVGELRDVDPGAYAAFADKSSEKRRKSEYKRWRSFQRRRAARFGMTPPAFPDEVRDAWLEQHPPGYFAYLEAMRPDGVYGSWIIERPAVVRVGDTIFAHGGISPDLTGLSLEEIDLRVRSELRKAEELRRRMVADDLILPTYRRAEVIATLQEEMAIERLRRGEEEEEPSQRERELNALVEELDELIGGSFAFGENGPLWFRGLAKWSDELLAPYLAPYLDERGLSRIVVAHTPSARGEIERRLGDRVFLIDTGMQALVYPGGRGSALEIEGGAVREIYERPREPEMAPAGALVTIAPQASAPASSPPARLERPGRQLLDAGGEPLPFNNEADILRILALGEVLRKKTLGVGITQPERVLLELDGVQVRAVFHDVDIQRNRARFKNLGIVPDFRDSYRSQVAAYQVAQLLGLDNVPPAVVREVDGVRGSAALWIEDSMMESERVAQGLPIRDPVVRTREFYDLRVFDNLIHNLDRNQTNILHDASGKLWMIDHTRSFGRSAKLLHPDKVVRCSRQLWNAIQALDPVTVERHLEGTITKPEIKALLKRRERLMELIRSRIESYGKAGFLFDWTQEAGDEADGAGVDELPPG